MLELDFWTQRLRLLGFIAIAISIVTWTMELTGMSMSAPTAGPSGRSSGLSAC